MGMPVVERSMLGRPDAHNPFEVITLLACSASVLRIVFTNHYAVAFAQNVPHWLRLVWATMIVLGTMLDLYGMRTKNYSWRPFLQQIGLAMFTASMLFYAVLVWDTNGFSFGVGTTTGFAVASLIRIFQLQLIIRELKRVSLQMMLSGG